VVLLIEGIHFGSQVLGVALGIAERRAGLGQWTNDNSRIASSCRLPAVQPIGTEEVARYPGNSAAT